MDEKFLIYVDMRLVQWADWFSKNNLYGLGYPSSTIEYRLMKEGVLINSTSPRQFLSNTDAEEIELLVKELERNIRNIGLALRSQYFGQKTSRERAERLGMSYAQFRILVDQGRLWLAGRLSAKNQKACR